MILVGQRVEIATRDGRVPGVVGKKPIHLLKDEDRKKVPRAQGPAHRHRRRRTATRRARWCAIGDVAVIAGEPVELPNDRVISRSMDNRLGCFVALEAARLVAEAGGAPGDVVARRGRRRRRSPSAARARPRTRCSPDVAIVVDVTFATDAPGIDEKELGTHQFGAGPVLDARLDARPDGLRAAARGRPRPRASRSRSTASARATGTDADAFHISRARHPDRRRLDPAALHALAGRDGPARRRRERREADRRLRAAARRPTLDFKR